MTNTNGLTYNEMILFNDLKIKANSGQISMMIDTLKREERKRNEQMRKEFEDARETNATNSQRV